MKSGIISGLALAAVAISVGAAPGGNKPPREPTVSGMEVFSAGQFIGYLFYPGLSDGDIVGIISSQGYLFELANDTGELRGDGSQTLFFVGTNCTGDAYMSDTYKSFQGYVLPTPVAVVHQFAYYSLRGSPTERVQYGSYLISAGVCNTPQSSPAWGNLRRAYPNDPAVTGVANQNYSAPLLFGIP